MHDNRSTNETSSVRSGTLELDHAGAQGIDKEIGARGARRAVGYPIERLLNRAEKETRASGARHALRALVPILVIAGWYCVSTYEIVDQSTIPSPLTVGAALSELVTSGELIQGLQASLSRAAVGLLAGLAIGIGFGLLNGLSKWGEIAFDSTLQIVRLIPFIALVPLFVVWFGIGEEPKVILIALACTFPAYLNTYSGVRNVDPKLVEAAQVFGLSNLDTIRRVIFPAAIASIIVGIRYSMGISLLALIVAEQINSQTGIGAIINVAAAAVRADLVLAGILVYAALGVIVDVVMRVIEYLSMPWTRAKKVMG